MTVSRDMGKGYGLCRISGNAGPMAQIRAADTTRGFHASDCDHKRAMVQRAKERRGRIDARPSPPDWQGTVRREIKIGCDGTAIYPIHQIGALQGFPQAEGMSFSRVEPHGSLHSIAARDGEIAHAVCDEANVFGVSVVDIINSLQATVFPSHGHTVIADCHSDLGCNEAGLIITCEHEAVDPARAPKRCLCGIDKGRTTSIDSNDVDVRAVSICIHSDTPNAITVAEAVAPHVDGPDP